MKTIQSKTCSRCGQTKEASSDYFAKGKRGKYGFRSICKECDKSYRKQHYESNKQLIRKKQAKYFSQYYQQNRKRILEQKKNYYRKLKGGDSI